MDSPYNSMRWFNEPAVWSANENTLHMYVTGGTDYWRITHYGFVVDDGPFLYREQGGEFEVTVKIRGDYRSRFDQMGLMIRLNEETWIKTGVEYVNSKINLSAVVTHVRSDWSVIELDRVPGELWIRAVRRHDAVEIFYSYDNANYQMMRLAWFPGQRPVMVGVTAASPDGDGFDAYFENFEIKHLPDAGRLKWLQDNR